MRLFVDTAAWLALNDGNDQYHDKAAIKAAEIKKHKIELLTSEYVLDEAVTIIRFRVSHRAAVVFGEAVFGSGIVRIMDVTEEHRFKAWEIFRKFGDKELSYTDCTSFALMHALKIRKAFTFDRHFAQMGFDIF